MVTLALKGSAISAKIAGKNDPAAKIIGYLQKENYQQPNSADITICADVIFASGATAEAATAALTNYLAAATGLSVKETSKAVKDLL